MHRHHPHRIERRRRIARDFDLVAIEPVEETLERRGRLTLEGQRGVEQFLDRIARFAAEPPHQLATPVERTRQYVFEEAIGRREIRTGENRTQSGRRLGKTDILGNPIPQTARPPEGSCIKFVLVQPEQGRDEQAREIEVILGLEHEPDRRHQIAYRQRRIKPQPIDARHRHTLGMQPRDDQRGELAALADEDQHILRP